MDKLLTRKVIANESELNRDPLSGKPGAHPLGAGAGAVSGGVLGAAVGTLAGGPVAALVGAVAGALVGGAAGKGLGEALNPTAEESYWREYYTREPYYADHKGYAYYAPGFRTGWEGRARSGGRRFEDAEPELRAAYEHLRTGDEPDWSVGRDAARAAWERIDHAWERRRTTESPGGNATPEALPGPV
jgi:hypothetical protein